MTAVTTTYGTRRQRRTEGRRRWLRPARAIHRVLHAIHERHRRRRQREALARLSERLLDDVGAHRDQATLLAQEPFWRL